MSPQQPNPHQQPDRRQQPPKKSLMQNLGEFFGHIAQGVTSDPNAPKPKQNSDTSGSAQPAPLTPASVVRQQTLEQQVETPDGKLILRRTIIDEVRRAEGPPETP